jgi:hypothetical protein
MMGWYILATVFAGLCAIVSFSEQPGRLFAAAGWGVATTMWAGRMIEVM